MGSAKTTSWNQSVDPQGILMMQCDTWSTRIEILSVEGDDNVVNVIATNLHLEWFRVTRSKDSREVAKSNALVDLSLREHRLILFPMKDAGRVLTH